MLTSSPELNCPGPHAAHEVAPLSFPVAEPALQSMQLSFIEKGAKWPSGHATHALSFLESTLREKR